MEKKHEEEEVKKSDYVDEDVKLEAERLGLLSK